MEKSSSAGVTPILAGAWNLFNMVETGRLSAHGAVNAAVGTDRRIADVAFDRVNGAQIRLARSALEMAVRADDLAADRTFARQAFQTKLPAACGTGKRAALTDRMFRGTDKDLRSLNLCPAVGACHHAAFADRACLLFGQRLLAGFVITRKIHFIDRKS